MRIKLLKSLKIFLTLSILITIGYYFYIKTFWTHFISEIELCDLISEIKSAPKLPENFYYIYEKQNPNALTYSSKTILFNRIIKDKYHFNSPSLQVSYYFKHKYNSRNKYKEFQTSLSWKLEKKLSQKECLNWLVTKKDFLFNQIGIRNASFFYFKKNINSLNDREFGTLVLMLKNPRLYNPKLLHSKNKFEKELTKLLK